MNYDKTYIKRIRKELKLTQAEMAERLDLSREWVVQMESGKKELSELTIVKLQKLEAEMTGKKPDEVKMVGFGEYMEVDYLPSYLQAGYFDSLMNDTPIELKKILVPKEFENGNYLVAEVSGDSMDDGTKRSLCDGDKILLQELDPIYYKNTKLHIKKNIFVIASRQGVVIKEIVEHKVGEYIICHSWNDFYKDFKIEMKDIRQIFFYKKTIERKPMF